MPEQEAKPGVIDATAVSMADRADVASARVAAQIKQHPGLVIAIVFCSALAALTEGVGVGLAAPLLTAEGSEQLAKLPVIGPIAASLSGYPLAERVRWIAALLVALTVVRGVLVYLGTAAAKLLPIRIESELKQLVMGRMLRVDLRTIHRHRVGELQTIAAPYTVQSGNLAQAMTLSVSHVFVLIVYGVLMVIVSPSLTALALALLVVLALLVRQFAGKRLQQLNEQRNKAMVAMNHFSIEVLQGGSVVRQLGKEAWAQEQFGEKVGDYIEQSQRSARYLAAITPAFTTLVGIGVAGMLVAATMIFDDALADSLPLIVLFLLVLLRLSLPALALNNLIGQAASVRPGYRAMLRFLETHAEDRATEGEAWPTMNEAMSFTDVHFRYGDDGDEVLRGVSLEIPRGEMIAVVGPSGGGKSTLANLMAGMFPPTSGHITIDGRPTDGISRQSWRSRVAVVNQEPFFFNRSIRENLCLGSQDKTDERLRDALRLANAADFVDAMPEGIDTNMGDLGTRLSGGQKQRIAIARAILTGADVLLLDEPTSHLDSESEKAIQASLQAMHGEKTIVVIAHRMATIRSADAILVIQDGQVVAQGKHDSLMEAGGLYRQLVDSQQILD